MKGRKCGAVAAAVVLLLSLALMLVRFAADGRGAEPLVHLPASQTVTGQGHPSAEGQININTASAEELDELPGIGPVKAAAIISWREENGPFRYPEDLIRVSGIGEKTLEKLLNRITVGGEWDAEDLSGGR